MHLFPGTSDHTQFTTPLSPPPLSTRLGEDQRCSPEALLRGGAAGWVPQKHLSHDVDGILTGIGD